MKYEIRVRYTSGNISTYSCDNYRIQNGVIILENKEEIDSVILHVSEKHAISIIISLSNVLDCGISEVSESLKA